ncbi:MAG: TolC family protein [Burkholderiaceae bacterium]|nr:TolC family protein [Burkholderiaceae bacterium]
MRLRRIRMAAAALAAFALGGCASFSADGGFGTVEQAASERLGKEVRWARSDDERAAIDTRVDALLAGPLTADAAVQVALLNNRGLQASFDELGIAEAGLVQAGRLPNPGFGFGRLRRGDETEIERSLHFDLARLLAMPMVREMESRRFERVKREAAAAMLALAADTRKAWVAAVAAEQSVRYMGQVREAADASAELARRMARAGNWNKLQQAREQGFYADAALGLARTERLRDATRERLTRLMGLWGGQTQFRLPERLPDLPEAPLDMPDVERRAIAERLDVQAARLGAEQTAKNLGLTQATRFVNVLELGAVRNASNEAPTQRGWEVSFELPLFDWSGARVARAEAIYMQSLNRAAAIAIDARSEVREAYRAYRSTFDIARHQRDEIVPIRNRIAEENLLRYNGMLIGVFELLADARAQIASVNGYIDALRDFWVAQADLDLALVGKPTLAMPAAGAAAPVAAGGGH